MQSKPSPNALTDSNAFEAPDKMELKLLVLVDRSTNPKPLSRFLHNLVRKTSIQVEASRLIFYKLASSNPYVFLPNPYGPGLHAVNLEWKRITFTEHEFLAKLATLVNDIIPGIKSETIVRHSLHGITKSLAESKEGPPDLIIVGKGPVNIWQRLRRSLGLAKTDIEELSEELAVPVVRVPESYDGKVFPVDGNCNTLLENHEADEPSLGLR